MNKGNLRFVVALCLMVAGSSVWAGGGGSSKKALEDSNPIILSHGMMGFSDDNPTGLVNIARYWGGMDDYLRSEGATIFAPVKSALGGLDDRGNDQKGQILMWMAANGFNEANIFGHSQGAPDTRYMISNLGMSNKIAVFTSINGVNNGAPLADIVNGIIPSWLEGFVDAVVDLLVGLIYGDNETDLIAALDSLQVANAPAFNANNPDMNGVSYQSYGSYITIPDLIQHPLMGIVHPATAAGGLIYGQGLTNDGLVPLSSQKYGDWNGGPSFGFFVTGIDHLQITNVAYTGEFWFDVEDFFMDMAKNAMDEQ